jgi:transposase-like protein
VTMETKKRRSFTIAQKLNAVKIAQEQGIKPTARELGIDRAMLTRWRRDVTKLQSLAAARGFNPVNHYRLPGAGKPSTISKDTETLLLQYLDRERELENKVTVQSLVHKLRMLEASFVTVRRHLLRRRIWRLLRQNNVGYRRVTHQAQLTRLSEKIIDDWVAYIKAKMAMVGITDDCVVNFDETNVYFSFDTVSTLNRRGERTVSARKADSTNRCTVMIGVSATGFKLRPYIIYKGSLGRTGRIAQEMKRVQEYQLTMMSQGGNETHLGYPVCNCYAVQPKAWMDEEKMLDWIDQVWKPWTATKTGPTMLILDEFTAHMTHEVRRKIADCGTHLEFVPGGYTSRLQVMDVGLNKPFKDCIRDQYDLWFLTAGDSKPHRTEVAAWIASSWEQLQESTILRTWQKIGIITREETNEEDAAPEESANELENLSTGDEAQDEERLDFLDFQQCFGIVDEDVDNNDEVSGTESISESTVTF